MGMRRTSVLLLSMDAFKDKANSFGRDKKGWRELFFKPETRDERVKEYIPEVLEESLEAQRAVLAEQTDRDKLIEHGQRVLKLLENKAPSPAVFPALNEMLQLYGSKHCLTQRSLNYLLYPNSDQHRSKRRGLNASVPDALVQNFGENLQSLIDAIEESGSSAHNKQIQEQKNVEPIDITLFVRCMSGMALANAHTNDFSNAVSCCDAALKYVVNKARRAAILAVKAGVQNHAGQYELAAETAKLCIDASLAAECQDIPALPSAYLHGAVALRKLNKPNEAVKLLQEAAERVPESDQIMQMLNDTLKVIDKASTLKLPNGNANKNEPVQISS